MQAPSPQPPPGGRGLGRLWIEDPSRSRLGMRAWLGLQRHALEIDGADLARAMRIGRVDPHGVTGRAPTTAIARGDVADTRSSSRKASSGWTGRTPRGDIVVEHDLHAHAQLDPAVH